MSVRTFYCKTCNLNFDYDVGLVELTGLLPRLGKKAKCPTCGAEITARDIMFESFKAMEKVPEDVKAAVFHLQAAKSWDERRRLLETNPHLMTQDAVTMLRLIRDTTRSIGVEDEVKGDDQLLWLVEQCRMYGISNTFKNIR